VVSKSLDSSSGLNLVPVLAQELLLIVETTMETTMETTVETVVVQLVSVNQNGVIVEVVMIIVVKDVKVDHALVDLLHLLHHHHHHLLETLVEVALLANANQNGATVEMAMTIVVKDVKVDLATEVEPNVELLVANLESAAQNGVIVELAMTIVVTSVKMVLNPHLKVCPLEL